MNEYYRLVFKNGTHSAWESDLDFITENAKFFNAKIEKRVVENNKVYAIPFSK